MSAISEIMQRVYDSKEFGVKGYSISLKDTFFLAHSANTYIVFIAEKSNLDGTNQSFSYVIYDVSQGTTVASSSDLYKEITSKLPMLTDLSNAGGKIDFVLKRALSKQLETMTESNVKHNGLLDNAKAAYISYLNEMKKMKSPSFKPIYDYFLENLGGTDHGII